MALKEIVTVSDEKNKHEIETENKNQEEKKELQKE